MSDKEFIIKADSSVYYFFYSTFVLGNVFFLSVVIAAVLKSSSMNQALVSLAIGLPISSMFLYSSYGSTKSLITKLTISNNQLKIKTGLGVIGMVKEYDLTADYTIEAYPFLNKNRSDFYISANGKKDMYGIKESSQLDANDLYKKDINVSLSMILVKHLNSLKSEV